MIKCLKCGKDNRDSACFCSFCASPLEKLTCPQCGIVTNAPGVQYCAKCGVKLISPVKLGTGMLPANALLHNQYQILSKIAQSSIGAIYQALDKTGKMVAIKEISTSAVSPSNRQNLIQEFRKEAGLLLSFSHSNITKVFDVFDENEREYLVMEYLEGRTLENIVNSTVGFISEQQVVSWGLQLCDALDYLHSQNPPFIFLNMEPGNVILTKDGRIKLIDFGSSTYLKPNQGADSATEFIPPEQKTSPPTPDTRSDIYSLGVTLHFLITKHNPDTTPAGLPLIRSINPRASLRLEQIISKATQRDRALRYQTIKDFKKDLLELSKIAPISKKPKIEFKDVTVTYKTPDGREFNAVENLNITIEEGEFLSIVGPSGCGKSTMIKLVAGLINPTKGEVLVDGKPVNGPGKERGMVFQAYTSFPWLTVKGNIEFGMKLNGVDEETRNQIAEKYINDMGLKGFENAYPKNLSGGMKQRVAIARTLANQSEILMMDEPFGALDSQTRSSMQELLLDVWQKSTKPLTILFITHDLEEALFMGDRILIFTHRPGRIGEIRVVPFSRPRTAELKTQVEFNNEEIELIKSFKAMEGK